MKNQNRWQEQLIKNLKKQKDEHDNSGHGGSIVEISLGGSDIDGIIELLEESKE